MWLTSPHLGSLSVQTPTVARLHGIPDGMPGAIATLKAMRQLARDSLREPAQHVRETALGIISGASGWISQIRCVQDWVQNNIQYVQDPTDDTGGVELVQTPQKTLEYRAGDCDDQSTLMAALLSAIGHPTRFIAVGFRGAPLSHVLTQTKVSSSGDDGRDWASVETIQPRPLGWFPAGVTSQYIMKV